MRADAKRFWTGGWSVRDRLKTELHSRMLRLQTWLLAAGLVVVVAALVAFFVNGRSTPSSVPGLVLFTAERRELPIVVSQVGTIESQEEVQIACEVEDLGTNLVQGTQILWVIPNGTLVKEGDLLVELDSATHKKLYDNQKVKTEAVRAARVGAEAAFANQESQNRADESAAQLRLEMAKLRDKMTTEDNGPQQLEVQEIRRSIDDINSEILAAQANLELKRRDKEGIKSLFKLGYAGKNELERSRLEFLRAEGQLAAQMNRLRSQTAVLRKKETLDREMVQMEAKGNVTYAENNLDEIKKRNLGRLMQVEASLMSARVALEKEEALLKRYQEQVDHCKILSPKDGMVVYSQNPQQDEEIHAGASVRNRQVIMTLPKLDRMQVRSRIPETVIDQVEEGMKADVRIEAFPGQKFQGTIQSIAVLPEATGAADESGPRTYATTVILEGSMGHLMPGMSASVEIPLDSIPNIISVPRESVLAEGAASWCYVQQGNHFAKRPVTTGRANDEDIEIEEGLAEGEKIVVNPAVLYDTLPSESRRASHVPPSTERRIATRSF